MGPSDYNKCVGPGSLGAVSALQNMEVGGCGHGDCYEVGPILRADRLNVIEIAPHGFRVKHLQRVVTVNHSEIRREIGQVQRRLLAAVSLNAAESRKRCVKKIPIL